MAINRGYIAALIAPDLRKVYYETGKERPLEHPMIFNVSEMEYNPVTDQQVSGLGTMPAKDEMRQFTLDEILIGGTKQYEATPFGLAVEISWEAWRDELYGVLAEMVKGLARASRNRQEVDAFSVMNNGFTSVTAGFTASTLFNTAHARIDATTYANRPSPEIGLSITGLQNMTVTFEGMTDERNMPRQMAPAMIAIHYAKKFVAREILGSSGKPYTAQNEINALLDEDLKVFIGHYFTSQTAWFALAEKGEHDLNFLWRDYPIFDCFDDPRTKSAVATAYQRHTQGVATPRGVYGSTG